jgi:tellurite resistance-related uncharacterized protein
VFENPKEEVLLKKGDVGVVEPQAYHSLDIQKEAKLYVAFYK